MTATGDATAQARLTAEECLRSGDFDGLLALEEQLRQDAEQWPYLWSVAVAIAAAERGRDDARALLDEAVDAGFFQAALFEDKLASCFGNDPDWPRLQARMEANVPPPPVVLLSWPDPPAMLAPQLERIADDRQARLCAMLPPVTGSAWETAKTLLTWVTTRWDHANGTVEQPDAVEILERAAAGERFSCREFSIVLTQALNAVGIPARRLALRRRNSHIGIGRGHVVSEAWIDDLGRWVVLDGQNGAYWADADGVPLGLVELRRAFLDGQAPARLVGLVTEHESTYAAGWWPYFAAGSTTGCEWGVGEAFGPIFQEGNVFTAERLLVDPAAAYPDLAAVAIGITGSADAPAVTVLTAHPYAVGCRVADGAQFWDVGPGESWALRSDPGEHSVDLFTVTAYGAHRGGRIDYRVTG
ncbi:transglutaminase domain-containing protein [Pseudonocardia sp. GCM10023141]|uniref:transglutaminase domain-containing protein n=1 Tax=Pseudonocardia sp. GCM10023141 TaxID=3252653 RepID=UPI00360E990B